MSVNPPRIVLPSIPPARRNRLILSAALVVLAFLALRAAASALLPYFLALLLCYILLPLVDFFDDQMPVGLRQRGLSRPLSIVLVYLIAATVVALVVWFIIPPAVEQLLLFIRQQPNLLEEGLTFANNLRRWYEENVPPQVQATLEDNLEQIALSLARTAQSWVTRTAVTVTNAVSFVLGFIVVPFFMFYVLNARSPLTRTVLSLIPDNRRADAQNLYRIVDSILSAYIRGQVLLMFFVGAMVTLGLTLLSVRYSVLLGLVAGLFEIIPFVGPILGLLPAATVALLQGPPVLALWTLILFLVIQQVENVLLVPRIAGGSVQLHPALIMVVLVIGNEVGGLFGLLASVPITAIVRDVVKYLYMRLADEPVPPAEAYHRIRTSRIVIEM